MTPAEVAALLRVSPRTLETWRRKNHGPRFFNVGGRPRYGRQDVLSWISQEREQAGKRAALKKQKILAKARTYKHDPTRLQVDVMFLHPHTEKPVRMRPVAAHGLSEEQAIAWGEEQGMAKYMALCKGPGAAPVDTMEEEEPKQRKIIPTLSELWPDFEAEHISEQKIGTRAGYASAWSVHIEPTLGSLPLDQIDKAALGRLMKAMKGMKKSSIRQVVARVTTCLGWAQEEGKLPEDFQIPKIKWKSKKVDPPIYSRAQLEILLEAARDHDDRVLLLLLIDAALRIGECAGLMWSDVDLVGGSMTIQRNVSRTVLQDTPKGEVGTIKLTARLAEALRQQRAVRKGRFVLVPKLRKVEHASDYVLGHVVRFLQEKAGLPAYGAHRIRHSVLSILARAGVTPYALQALARHAHLSTTMEFYIHLNKAELAAQAIEALDIPSPSGKNLAKTGKGQQLPARRLYVV